GCSADRGRGGAGDHRDPRVGRQDDAAAWQDAAAQGERDEGRRGDEAGGLQVTEEPKKRTVAEIEADLQRTREELTRTVDELSGRVDPRRQVEEIRNQARAKFSSASAQGKSFV